MVSALTVVAFVSCDKSDLGTSCPPPPDTSSSGGSSGGSSGSSTGVASTGSTGSSAAGTSSSSSTGGGSSTTTTASGDEVDSPASFYRNSVCDSFICVSSLTRSNYCSKACFTDSQCPDGFVCATLQPVGPYADTKFCLLQKVCNTNNDCPKDGFVCNTNVPTSDGTKARYCDVKN